MPVTESSLIDALEAQIGSQVDPQVAAEIERQLEQERRYKPIPPVQPEPMPTSGLLRTGRPATTMGGSMLGARIGTPLGPKGMAVGGLLGAGIGSMAYDTSLDVAKAADLLPPQYPVLGEGQRAMEAVRQMQWEAGGQAAGQLLGMPIARMIGHKAAGIRQGTPIRPPASGIAPTAKVGTEAQQKAMQAKKVGVDVGIADVSPRAWARGWAKVVGRFPFVGTPFKKAAAGKAAQAGHGLDDIVLNLGPTVSMAEQGVNLNKAAIKSFKSFRAQAAQLYTQAREVGKEAGYVIPTQPIKEALEGIAEKESKRWRIIQETEQGKRLVPSRAPQADEVGDFLENAAQIENRLTAEQLDTFVDDLNVLMGRAKSQGWDIARLMEVKKAAETALRDESVAVAAPELAEAITKADDFFARGMRTFETPTAQKFARVTKGGFKVGLKQQGNLNEDELFRLAWNDKSPQAMRDLRKLVKPKVFKQALNTHLRNIYNQSAANTGYLGRLNADLPEGSKIIDPNRFLAKLGMSQPGSAEFDALKESLRGSGITPDALRDFAETIKTAFSTEVPDVSTFMARRVTLGGARSLMRGLAGPGGAVMAGTGAAGGLTSSPLLAAGITVLTRHMGTVLTDPTKLRLFTTSLRQSVPYAQRRAAMVRLLMKLGQTEGASVEDIGL